MNARQKIQAVINTLNQVEVSGKKNIDRLLGSILVLEQVEKELGVKANEDKPD